MRSVFTVLLRGPLEEDFNKISTRSSDKDLYEIMQLPFQDYTRSSTKAFHKELEKTLTPTRAHKIVIKGPAAAGAGEDLTRA